MTEKNTGKLSGCVAALPTESPSHAPSHAIHNASTDLPDTVVTLVDLRQRAAYVQGHHADASHLPFAALVLRRHELPAPAACLHLQHDQPDELAQASAQLQAWGYVVSTVELLDATRLVHWQAQACWQTGEQSREPWQPSASLLLALSQFLPAAASGATALDLACGSGRDALFLAQRSYDVHAIDHKPDALARLQASADARQLRIHCHCLDLEAADLSFPPAVAAVPFNLITVARYLHRPLLPRLPGWLAAGGWLIYETFVQGAEAFGGPRRPAFLLAPGELAQCYRELQILHDVIVRLPDGRPVQQFIARRRP